MSRQGVIERKLLNDLFNGTSYNKLERPVWNDSEALVVQFGLTLQQIIDVVPTQLIIQLKLNSQSTRQKIMVLQNVWLHISFLILWYILIQGRHLRGTGAVALPPPPSKEKEKRKKKKIKKIKKKKKKERKKEGNYE